MIKVGLTGGIGTGKTMVSRIFSELQVPVFYGDPEAKKPYADAAVLEKVKKSFGEEVFENGAVSYKKLAQIVFNDQAKLEELNSIIHPFLFSNFNKWTEEQKNAPYVIMEAAILYESSFYQMFDKIITVSAPEELCIERVTKRDGTGREEVLNRMRNQLPDNFKTTKADFVIINDGVAMLLPQVLDVHRKLLNL
ncbi:MAG TPA: dephospho-CoA kinase [Bacteroidales bacterium]|nr:dephospho-CoA kinase [Bacteroidales bacterium]